MFGFTSSLETSGYYALGIPLFLVLVALERRLLARRGIHPPLADAINNLSCGLGQVLVGVFTGPVILLLYQLAWRLRVGQLPSLVSWPLAFVGVDFCYYWFHRTGHTSAALWTIHSVHHQSERFDLSVALRQPWISDLTAILFYWPLPLLGVPALPFFGAVAVLSLYQVTLHTELVGEAGWRGVLLNTPSHHRVHHALDARGGRGANFGATLIVWDRLFGTFIPERARIMRYGTSDGHPGWHPVRAQLHAAARLMARLRGARLLSARLVRLASPPAPSHTAQREPAAPSPAVGRRVLVELLLVTALAIPVLDARHLLPTVLVAAFAAFALAIQLRWGRMLERAPST